MSNQYPYYYNTYSGYNVDQPDNSREESGASNQNASYSAVGHAPTRTNYWTSAQQPTYQPYQQPQQSGTASGWYPANGGQAQAAQALTSMQSKPTPQARLISPAVTPASNAPASNANNHSSLYQNQDRTTSGSSRRAHGAHAQQQTQQLYSASTNYPASHNQSRPGSVNSVRSQSVASQSPQVAAPAKLYQQQQQQQQQPGYQTSPAQSSVNQVYSQLAAQANSASHLPPVSNVTQASQTASAPYLTATSNMDTRSDQSYNEANFSTVDPTVVYDPWPEYQRKLEAARRIKAAEEAQSKQKAEQEERVAEVERLRKQQEEEKVAEARRVRLEAERAAQTIAEPEPMAEEQGNAEAEAEAARVKEERKAKAAQKRREAKERKKQQGAQAVDKSAAPQPQADGSRSFDPHSAEAKLREMMAMIRSMNENNPDLVARIWEEERQQHTQTTNKPTADQPREIAAVPAAPTPRSGTKASSAKKSMKLAGSASNSGTASAPVPSPKFTANTAVSVIHQPSPIVPEISSNGAIVPPKVTTTSAPQGQNVNSRFATLTMDYLLKLPGHSITLADVKEMLRDNPSYPKFCKRLEAKGAKINKSALARLLKPAMGDKPTAVNKVPAANVQNVESSTAAQPVSLSGVVSAAAQKIPVVLNPSPVNNAQISTPFDGGRWNPSAMPAYEIPLAPGDNRLGPSVNYTTGSPAGRNSQSARYSLDAQPYGVLPKAVSDTMEPSVAVSETPVPSQSEVPEKAMARKRKFSSLVDLTAEDEDDDDLPLVKRVPVAPLTSMQTAATHMRPYIPAGIYGYGLGYQSYAPQSYAQMQTPPYDTQNVYHPARPLDPQQPPPPPPAMIAKFKDVDLVQVVDRTKARRRNEYDVRTIARDVLLATGRHPEMPGLNWHLDSLRTSLRGKVGEHADLTTLRWDLIDPGEPIPLPALEEDKGSIIADDADDESDQASATIEPRVAVRVAATTVDRSGNGIPIPQIEMPDAASVKSAIAPPRRRGRPPKNRQTLGALELSASNTNTNTRSSDTRGDFGRRQAIGNDIAPTARMTSTPRTAAGKAAAQDHSGNSYAAMRAQAEASGNPLPKKRGRPVGWRKDPNKIAVVRPNIAELPEIKFPVFKCEWEGCKAELHNLVTLKKHISNVHSGKNSRGKHECRWRTCMATHEVFDRAEKKIVAIRRGLEFNDLKPWDDHVQATHISAAGWKQGDGFASSHSEAENSEAYLSDAQGRQRTPRIPTPPGIVEQIYSRPIPQYVPAPPSPREGSVAERHQQRQQMLEKAQRARNIIGPGLDRDGQSIATPEARAMLDTSDFEEYVVPAGARPGYIPPGGIKRREAEDSDEEMERPDFAPRRRM